MKKILSFVLFAMMAVQLTYAGDIIDQEIDKLPVEARNFINQHFPQATISHVKVEDKLLMDKKYEVLFSSGMEIEFDSKGNWTEIDTKSDRLPVAIVPASVREYIQSTYSGNYATKIEHDKDGYELTLNNGLSLKFDQGGKFKKVDD